MSNLRFVMSNRFEVFDRLWIPQIVFWMMYRFPASQIGYSIFDPVQLDMIENRFDIVFEDLDRKSINMDKDRKKNKLIYMAVSILFCDPTSDPFTYCNFR